MSGHSKWATTKRHKAAVDAKRGRSSALSAKKLLCCKRRRQASSSILDSALSLSAKQANMPADNITSGPSRKGPASLVASRSRNTLRGLWTGRGRSDSRGHMTTRTVRLPKYEAFSKGGNLAGAGALLPNFKRKGQFLPRTRWTKTP